MTNLSRIESALQQALERVSATAIAPRLAQAARYAVFPGGGRLRPRLCCAVAAACGVGDSALTDAAAAAIEFIHCASLVHDDLPCFDDSPLRRGRPSVHRAFGEPIAVLVGDALIALAFETLADASRAQPERLPGLVTNLALAIGLPGGLVAGQALEDETDVSLSGYQNAKTGALFSAATVAGALTAGVNAEPWRLLGARLGEAYQVADDIRDVAGAVSDLGKPTGRDAALMRPNAVAAFGLGGAISHLKQLVADAQDAIPACPGKTMLQELILGEAGGLLPKHLRSAA